MGSEAGGLDAGVASAADPALHATALDEGRGVLLVFAVDRPLDLSEATVISCQHVDAAADLLPNLEAALVPDRYLHLPRRRVGSSVIKLSRTRQIAAR